MNLIDTSILIRDLREGMHRTGYVSVITLIEILRGVGEEKRGEVKQLLEEAFDVIPITNPVIEIYCMLHSHLKEKGTTLPDADILIAASAIAEDLILLTRDKGFSRLEKMGLKISFQN